MVASLIHFCYIIEYLQYYVHFFIISPLSFHAENNPDQLVREGYMYMLVTGQWHMLDIGYWHILVQVYSGISHSDSVTMVSSLIYFCYITGYTRYLCEFLYYIPALILCRK